MSSAESYYLQAEVALLGFGSGNAQALFHKGIETAFSLWNTNPEEYLSKDVAMLTGSLDENLEKLMTQRWVTNYTTGFEGWAILVNLDILWM